MPETTTQVITTVSPSQQSAISLAEKTENTRNLIALVFITTYLILLIVLITLSTFFHLSEQSSKDFLLAVGTPLGFIIGFYFKTTAVN